MLECVPANKEVPLFLRIFFLFIYLTNSYKSMIKHRKFAMKKRAIGRS